MLFRCNVDSQHGLIDLYQASILAACFQARGHRVAYAINREGVDEARRFLGEEAQIFRIPDAPEEDAERLGHLGRTHKHRVVFVILRAATSAYLFQVHRLFNFTAVVDRGSSQMIYANLLINGGVSAHHHVYNCCPEARLLLGPRYYICDPAPLPPARWPDPPGQILVSLGNDMELLLEALTGLLELDGEPEIHVLLPNEQAQEQLRAQVVDLDMSRLSVHIPEQGTAFAYHRYPLILLEMDDLCMQLAHQGLCFVTVATDKDRLQDAYLLEQLGAAATLGWRGSKKAAAIRDMFALLLAEPGRCDSYRRHSQQLVDGQAVLRIANFVPGEAPGTN